MEATNQPTTTAPQNNLWLSTECTLSPHHTRTIYLVFRPFSSSFSFLLIFIFCFRFRILFPPLLPAAAYNDILASRAVPNRPEEDVGVTVCTTDVVVRRLCEGSAASGAPSGGMPCSRSPLPSGGQE